MRAEHRALITGASGIFLLWEKINKFDGEMEPDEKIAGLESLLSPRLSLEMKRYIYEQIFKVAEKAGNTTSLVKYGEILFAIDRTDAAVPAKISLAFANKKNVPKALYYAQLAEQATAVFVLSPVLLTTAALTKSGVRSDFLKNASSNIIKTCARSLWMLSGGRFSRQGV
jgi:hypothetical protein